MEPTATNVKVSYGDKEYYTPGLWRVFLAPFTFHLAWVALILMTGFGMLAERLLLDTHHFDLKVTAKKPRP